MIDKYSFTDAGKDLFKKVAVVVRSGLPTISEAGQWLDQEYTAEAICLRYESERKQVVYQNENIEKRNRRIRKEHADRLRSLRRQRFTSMNDAEQAVLFRKIHGLDHRRHLGKGVMPGIWSKDELPCPPGEILSKFDRFGFAWQDTIYEGSNYEGTIREPIRLLDLPLEHRIERAGRIILLAWLITDPDANTVARVTQFHKGWPWIPEQRDMPGVLDNDTDRCLDRCYTRTTMLDYGPRPIWISLAEESLDVLQPLSESTYAVTHNGSVRQPGRQTRGCCLPCRTPAIHGRHVADRT